MPTIWPGSLRRWCAAKLGPRLLDTYEVERRDHVWAMIEMALRMGRVMAPRSQAEAFLVQNGFRLLGLYPPARDYFAQMRFKPSPRFANGFLLPDGRECAPHAGRPAVSAAGCAAR